MKIFISTLWTQKFPKLEKTICQVDIMQSYQLLINQGVLH